MGDESGLGGSLLAAAQDVLEAVLQEVDAAALRQLKAASVAWCAHARRELCHRLWVRLSRREGQPEPAGVDSITDLDVECLNEAGRPWEVVVAGRQLPQLARLHGWGFVVDVQAVREAGPGAEQEEDDDDEEDEDAPLSSVTLRSCIQGEGDPPDELLLAAVACAAPGTVRGVPVQRLREDDAIGELDLHESGIGDIAATLLGLMLPAAMSVRSLDISYNNIGAEGASALAAVLKETQIQQLDIGCNSIGKEGATTLAAILKETKMTHLGLHLNGIGDKGASALAAVLKETQISDLDLGWNNIGAEGASALAAVLKETQITTLDLRSNNIGDKGASALAAVLKETQITTLNVGYNYITGDAAENLAMVVLEHASMTDFCGIPLTSLRENSITELNLGNKGVGMPGAIVLSKLLPSAVALTSLNLRDMLHSLNDEAVQQALQDAAAGSSVQIEF